MFLFFVNDIQNNINSNIEGVFTTEQIKIFILLFADDAVIFAETPNALQSMLTDLERYCNTWGLKINTNKTKIMIFERGRSTHYNFTLCDTDLEVVDSFKYLGIHLFKNGSWYRTQKRLAQHSKFALHNLFIVLNQIELTTYDKCRLFDSLVGSILNYSAAVWGNHDSKDIELVHCKFLRKVLNVKKSTNLDGLYGELGRYPMKITRQLIMIRYWTKIIKSPNPLIRAVYNMLEMDTNNGNSYSGLNWAHQIKSIFYNIGMQYVWDEHHTLEISYIHIKQRILDIYKQTWYTSINNSSRLASYSLFKHEFKLEKYLSYIPDKKYQIALTKLRLSSHDLAIETGRYTNIDRQLRICRKCNMGFIENEYHFLLVCTNYRDLRQKYFKPYYCRWPSVHKFIDLMSNNSVRIINNLAKFVYFAFKKRNQENM